jgi:hypothetical protein
MGKARDTDDMPIKKVWKRLIGWRLGRRLVLCLVLGTALVVCFLAEEYWRGKRAWETCRTELASKGAALEWEDLNSTPVDEQDNFFAAPGMMDWFGSAEPSELNEKLSLASVDGTANLADNQELARIEIVATDAEVAEREADIVLRYRNSSLALSAFGRGRPEDIDPESAILPLIVMEDVPLAIAIQNLARHAGLNYLLDPRTQLNGEEPQPMVTIRWENVTARQALKALLDNYSLERVDSPQGIARIQPKDQEVPSVYVEARVRERLETLLRTALAEGGTPLPINGLIGAQNIALVNQPITVSKPLKLAVRTDELLTEKEMAQFLPATVFGSLGNDGNGFQVTAATASAYKVKLAPRPCCKPGDYLAWTDRCQPEFERIRMALQRPGTRLLGICEQPDGVPERNFVTVRVVMQTLAQRAQSDLMLNETDAALRELTLIHDLRRVLTCKPVTLVAGMVNVAVTGVYLEVVKDGLRMNAWQEPHLAVIERQLSEINLVPPVAEAFQRERLIVLQMLENGRLAELYRRSEAVILPPAQLNGLQKLKRASYGLLTLVPRGWVYQNMAAIGSLHQGFLDAANTTSGEIDLQRIEAASQRVQEVMKERRPETFLTVAAFPLFTRAWQTVARNQALVNEVNAWCALERDHLARGRRPETADAEQFNFRVEP